MVSLPSKENTVDLFIDNLVRGMISISRDADEKTKKLRAELVSAIRVYKGMDVLLDEASTTFDPDQYNEMIGEKIDELYDLIIESRIEGIISGELRDFELEKKFKELEHDNKRLALELAHTTKELEQLRPPEQNKNFKAVG